MKIMLRLECEPEVEQALVEAWLKDYATTITTATASHRGAETTEHSVRLTYVRTL